MPMHAAAVSRYFEAWNATDADGLAKAVAAAWSEEGTYTDPLADVRGHEAIAAVIRAAHEQFPGFEFKLTGEVDGNHHIARFSWELVSTADGSAPVSRLGCDHPGRGRPDHLGPRLPRPDPRRLTLRPTAAGTPPGAYTCSADSSLPDGVLVRKVTALRSWPSRARPPRDRPGLGRRDSGVRP